MVGEMVQNSQSLYSFTFSAVIVIHEYIYSHSTTEFTFKKYIYSDLTVYFFFTIIFTHIYGMCSFTFNVCYIRSHSRSKYSLPRSRRRARSCFAFGLFFFKPRSRRVGGFLICLRFFFFRFVCNYIQTSADDVIISQLQAISQLFSSYLLSGEFC